MMKISEITGNEKVKILKEGYKLTDAEIIHLFDVLANKEYTKIGKLKKLVSKKRTI